MMGEMVQFLSKISTFEFFSKSFHQISLKLYLKTGIKVKNFIMPKMGNRVISRAKINSFGLSCKSVYYIFLNLYQVNSITKWMKVIFYYFKENVMSKIGERGHFWAQNQYFYLFSTFVQQVYLKLYQITVIKKWMKLTVFNV